MRRAWCAVLLCLVVFGALEIAAQKDAGEQYLGQWSGTWEGAGSSGGFNLTLEKGEDAALGCKVSVTGEPAYDAICSKVSFEGGKMTAVYDFPPDDRLQVLLTAVFDGKSAKGGWIAREKGGTNEMASGSWAVTKKE